MPKDVGVAIMAKIDMMYGAATEPGLDQFVTFNFPAMPWSREGLAFADPVQRIKPENMRFNAFFSEMVNQVPEVAAVYKSNGTRLWDVWRLLISNMKRSSRTLSAHEQTDLNAAIALLGADEGGSPKYRSYLEHRDRCGAASMALESNRITILMSDDPNAKAVAAAHSARLQRDIDDAQHDWAAMGFKGEIETAIHTKERLLSVPFRPGPYLTALDLAMRSDFTVGKWIDSAFVPPDLGADAARWATVTLDKTEILQLVEGAPQAIRDVAAGLALVNENDSPNPVVERVTMEMARASVTRPWFEPLVFLASGWTWDLPDMLCDGADPPGGLLPAYITDVVFVRNITFELQRNAPQNRAVLNRIAAGKQLQVGMFQVKAQRRPDNSVALKAKSLDMARLPPAKQAKMARSFSAAGLSSPQLRLVSEMAVVRPSSVPVQPRAMTRTHPITHSVTPVMMRVAAPPPRVLVTTSPQTIPRVRAAPPMRPPASAEDGLPTTSSVDEEDLQIAAFVCRRLPRLPTSTG